MILGSDHEPKMDKMMNRRNECEKNLGEEGIQKVRANREFVETYKGIELFNKELIEVKYSDQKGFHVVAKTDISKGTLIMEEKAEYYAPLKYDTHFPGKSFRVFFIVL